jgi:hypothetical protein
LRAAEPPVLLGFAPSKDSTTSGAIRGAEQPSLSTVLRVDARRRRRYDRQAGRCSWRALDASTTPVFSEADAPRIQYRHQDPLAHPDRVRVPQPRPSHRSRTRCPQQPPTAIPRPKLTHTCSRRVTYGRPYCRRWAVRAHASAPHLDVLPSRHFQVSRSLMSNPGEEIGTNPSHASSTCGSMLRSSR